MFAHLVVFFTGLSGRCSHASKEDGRPLGSKEGHTIRWPMCSWQPLGDGPAALHALDCCFSMQHGLLITSVMRTTLAMLGPLQHLSLPECACSPSPALFISSPSSSGKGGVIKHLEKLSSTCRVSMGDGVGESRDSWVWAVQQGLWERWVPTC